MTATATDQSVISASQFPDHVSQPPDASAAWGAFSLYEMEPPDRAAMTCSEHVLSLVVSGTCRLRREVGGRAIEGWSGPGTFSLLPAYVGSMWEGREHRGATRTIAVFVPQTFLSRMIAEEWDKEPKRVEILDRFLARDPIVESVLRRLAHEAREQAPMGQLYAESACAFLAHHLVRSHSSLAAPAPKRSGGLPARRLARVLEYIEANLAHALTLRGMAEQASVSPRHFERAFRQALGVAPHAYVLGTRVTTAQHLLVRTPRLSIDEIARQVGFSSASHFASTFRRQTGVSPTAFRARHSR